MNYTQTLADFAVKTQFEDLPGEVVNDTKRVILDTIGCGVGGYSLKRGKIVAELARDLGGAPEATVFGSGDKVSCANAAFANADLANALDADETFLNFSHFANVIVANALALAEREAATGKDLIAAVAIGFDITARIGLSMPLFRIVGKAPHEKIEQMPGGGMGFITPGGAATAGKLLHLDSEKMADAFGLAGANAAPPSVKKLISQPFSTHKHVSYGLIAHTGVLAALLAEKGYTGDRTVLDGDLGLWRFLGSTGVDWEVLVGNLGKKWWIAEDSFKPYPCCRYLGAGLDLFYKTIREQKIKPEEIETVIFRLHPPAMGHHTMAKPSLTFDPTDPATPINLEFNPLYVIAMAALGVKPGPDWYSPKTMADSRVSEFMRKVKVEPDPEALKGILEAMRGEPVKRFKKVPSSITVIARGKAFDAHTDYAIGDPWVAETRMSDDQLNDKFRSFCYKIIGHSKIEKAIKSISELEKLNNVTELTELLVS